MLNINTFLMLGAAVLAGAVVPFQAGANAALGRALGHPLWATLASLGISAALVIIVMLVLRVPEPAFGAAARGPWWLWVGGAAGAVYVVTALVLAPRLGAAHFIVAVVAGQMAVSLLIDHFGLMGFAHKPVGAARLAGLLLIVAGMLVTHMASGAALPRATAGTAAQDEIRSELSIREDCQDGHDTANSVKQDRTRRTGERRHP